MADWRSVKGTVKAVNDKYGGALTFGEPGPDGKDIWWKFSKPEYREAAFHIPQKGEAVELIADIEGRWVKSIVPMNGAPQQQPPQVYANARTLDEPEWPPDEAYSEPVPERDVNQDVAPRRKSTDESIQLQVAIKCATEIMVALIHQKQYPPDYEPEHIAADVAVMANAIAVVYSE